MRNRLRSRRHDNHLYCYFYVPPHVPPGDYTLQVEVRDLTGLPPSTKLPDHRRAQSPELPFHLRGGDGRGLVSSTKGP